MRRTIWKPWVLQPIWHSLLGWLFTIAFVAFFLSKDLPLNLGAIVGIFFLFIAVTFPMITVIVAIRTYPTAERYLRNLILLFLALTLVFANLYFLMLIFPNEPPFEGLHSPWVWLEGTQGRRMYIENVALAIIDCLHFSCVTITTLGFGDIRPTHWVAKLVTDAEVLMGVGLVVIGFGRLFARSAMSPK